MTATRLQSAILGFVLIVGTLPGSMKGQNAQVQAPVASGQAPRRAPIAHYYWHFLVHQHELDVWAAAQAANGHDVSALRNHLQKSMGLSDTDYAPVRASSVRLVTEVKTLDALAVAIRAAGPSPTTYTQLQALTTQRETYINSEVTFLKSNLSPAKIALMETFMVQFFSPAKGVVRPGTGSLQAAPSAVQP